MALVVAHGLRLVAHGLLIGVPAALSLRWFVEPELVRTSSIDTAICAEAIALVTAAGFASVFVPSLRAARVEPARLVRSH